MENVGRKFLSTADFVSKKNKKTQTKIYWRCWRKDCRASVVTNLQLDVLSSAEHNHGPDDAVLKHDKAREGIKRSIRRDPSQGLKKAYTRYVRDCREEDVEDTPSYHRLKSALKRARQSLMPPLPTAIDDVRIRGKWGRTLSGERFLQRCDNDWGIAVFTTKKNLEVLAQCEVVFMDGTFRTAPHPYTQMFTVHGLYQGRCIVLVMALLVDKTVASYRQVLATVKDKTRELTDNQRFRPRKVVIDMEMSLLVALETEFPRARISACYFHFCQALWRKVQELGLTRPFRRDERLRIMIEKIMAIGYLPPQIVRTNLDLLLAAERRLQRRYPALTDFLTYFRNNYMDGMLRPSIWNVYRRNMDTRTNNYVECKLCLICILSYRMQI